MLTDLSEWVHCVLRATRSTASGNGDSRSNPNRQSGGDLEAYEVSTLVNNPANDRAECAEPLLTLPLV